MLENTEAWLNVARLTRYGPGKFIPTNAPVPTGHGVG